MRTSRDFRQWQEHGSEADAAGQRGSVLIVVLWASFGLVAIALLFGHSMIMSYRGADNDLAGRQAGQAIEGAARYAMALLDEQVTPGTLPDPLTTSFETLAAGDATIWFLGRSTETFDGTLREYGLVDEASKLNLNTVPPAILTTLFNTFPDAPQELADTINTWRTPATTTATTGGGVTGSTNKQGPFESVEELALISGVTRALLYGEDANMNGVLDPNEDDGDSSLPSDNGDGKLDAGLLEYLTIFASEPEKDSSGGELLTLDPNPPAPATPPDMAGLLTALTTAAVADPQAIVTALQAQPAPGGPPTGMPTNVLDLLIRGKVTAEDEPKIVGAIRNAAVNRLVNVNTASEKVLACIPGLANKAAEIVAARAGRATQSASMLWLKDIGLAADEIRDSGPYLTGRSFQVTADIAAVGRNGRGYRRMKAVIDSNPYPPPPVTTTTTTTTTTTARTTRIVYRRNLAPLGWALGREVRQEVALKKEVK